MNYEIHQLLECQYGDKIASRSESLLIQAQIDLHQKADRMFAVLLIFQCALCIVLACTVTPYTWIGAEKNIHIHVWASVGLGFLLTVYPLYLIKTQSGTVLTRQVIAVAQILYSCLLIHVTGGRIETHFHVFGSLAFLAFYRDWRVLLTATIITAMDHFFRGIYWPESVFGVVTSTYWRWLEHTAWVIFEDIILLYQCQYSLIEMQWNAHAQAKLELIGNYFEEMVSDKTEKLNATLLQQQALINNIPDMAWMKDRDGRFIAVNNKLTKAIQHDAEYIIGKKDVDLWSPEIAEKYAADDRYVMETQETLKLQETFRDAEGRIYWLETIKTPILNDRSEVIGTVGIARDVTENKEYSESLNKSNLELSVAKYMLEKELLERKLLEDKLVHLQKMEAVGTLTGGIAHDFNNILWMIMGNSEMLLDALVKDSELKDMQQDIYNAASRGRQLVQQLLDYSRHKEEVEKHVFQVLPVIQEVTKLLRASIPSSIEFILDIEAPECEILGNTDQLHQILTNLCTNAYQAVGTSGRITLGLYKVNMSEEALECFPELKQPGEYVVIKVSDTGSGIPEELIGRIFDPFFTTKEVGKGTGLGLSMVHGLVQKMNGAVHVDSAPDCGSHFHIYLPSSPKPSLVTPA
ncbi:MAG: nitrogen regulation protein NR(II) [Candidatus Melainabacteria bacterium]